VLDLRNITTIILKNEVVEDTLKRKREIQTNQDESKVEEGKKKDKKKNTKAHTSSPALIDGISDVELPRGSERIF